MKRCKSMGSWLLLPIEKFGAEAGVATIPKRTGVVSPRDLLKTDDAEPIAIPGLVAKPLE